MIDERIAQRRAQVREDRRRRRLRRTVLGASLLVLTVVGVLVERSSLVALAEVRVEGLERLDDAQVRSAADLALGTSTLRLRLGAAERRVESLPLVADAVVHRLDPLTVLVEVTERTPAAVVSLGARAVLVDDEGVVIDRGREGGLARIRIRRGPLPEPGQALDVHPAAANAHRVMAGLPGPLRPLIDRYDAISEDELVLVLSDGTPVQFGRADRVEEKARALGALLEDLRGRPVSEIDVRAPSRPVVTP